jgi:hypothetical protein
MAPKIICVVKQDGRLWFGTQPAPDHLEVQRQRLRGPKSDDGLHRNVSPHLGGKVEASRK